MAYVNVAKPTGTNYTNVNIVGRQTFDESSLTYDDSTTFYDGVNQSQYTKVNKPTGTNYTNIAKPT